MGCGLMQKKDITQHDQKAAFVAESCGLMQKKDITQLAYAFAKADFRCGLMQKKDITQLFSNSLRLLSVVV